MTEETLETLQEETSVEEVAEVAEQPTEQPEVKAEESYQEKNFRSLREEKERIARERDEALSFIKTMAQQNQTQPKQQQPEEEDITIGDDDLVEGKHLNRTLKKINRQLEEQRRLVEEQNKRAQETSIETRIKSQYPDFDAVVNQANIAAFRDAHPDLASTLNSSQDLYSKAISAYKLFKKFGIYKDTSYDSNKNVVQNNTSKPRPASSLSPQEGSSPLTRANEFANGLTDELKERLYKEMMECRKNA